MLIITQLISTITIAVFLLLLIAGTIKSIKVTRLFYTMAILTAMAVAVWGYSFIPNTGHDLYRLYLNINGMKWGGWEENVINNTGVYSGLYAFNALCYLIAQFDNNQLLPCIAALVVFSIMLTILISYFRSEGYSTKALLLSAAMIFAGMQIQYVFSGIRNAIAVSLTILALYLFFYKEKHPILSVILYLVACTIHSMVLVLLPVVLLACLPPQKVYRFIALFSIPMVFVFAAVFQSIPNTFLQYLGNRLLFYQTRSYMFDRPEMIANAVFFVLIGGGYWYLKKRSYVQPISEKHKRFENVYYLLGFVMLGSMVRRDFALRIGYIMGTLNIPMLCCLLKAKFPDNKHGRTLRRIWFLALIVIIICLLKVYYDTYYTMNKMVFM